MCCSKERNSGGAGESAEGGSPAGETLAQGGHGEGAGRGPAAADPHTLAGAAWPPGARRTSQLPRHLLRTYCVPAEAPWTQRGDPVRFRWADQGNYPEDTSYHGSVQNPPDRSSRGRASIPGVPGLGEGRGEHERLRCTVKCRASRRSSVSRELQVSSFPIIPQLSTHPINHSSN